MITTWSSHERGDGCTNNARTAITGVMIAATVNIPRSTLSRQGSRSALMCSCC